MDIHRTSLNATRMAQKRAMLVSMRTYEARVHLNAADAQMIDAYAARFSRALRSLHARRAAKRTCTKSAFIAEFGCAARQFNAVRVALDGMIASLNELRPRPVEELAHRIESIEAKIASTTSAQNIHLLRNRLARLTMRKAYLESDNVAICSRNRAISIERALARREAES